MNANYIANYFKGNFSPDRACVPEHFASVCYDEKPVFLHQPKEKQETFSVQKGDLEFKIVMRSYPEYNAVDWLTTVTNHSDEPSGILSKLSVMDIVIPVPAQEEIVHKGINGDSCTGDSFLPFAAPIACGESAFFKPKGGKSSHQAFPFFDICGKGDGLICGIGWTGNWFYEIQRTEENLILKAGLPDARFYMKPHETLRLPRILLMAYEGDNVSAHNCFRKLMKERFSPRMRFGDKMRMPIALQNFDRYDNVVLKEIVFRETGLQLTDVPEWASEDSQLKEIDYEVKCKYSDTYWLDAAWFDGGFPAGVGNYAFRKEFPEGLTNISRHAHENGIRTMIWFEPERIYEGSQIDREHPEFLLYKKEEGSEDQSICKERLFNMADPEAVDFMIDLIGGFIEKYEIDIYRQDFNIYPDAFWEYKDEPDRIGITEIKYVEGEYRFLDALLQRFPNLMIDNCASGGNRIDLESCIRCIFCWRSDTGCFPTTEKYRNNLWNQNQNLALSDYIVYHAIASWDAEAYAVRSAMSNGFAANFDVFDPDCDFEYFQKILGECQRLGKYWEEDFYPLSAADLKEDHWSMCQFGGRDSGVVMIFRRNEDKQEQQVISLRGLEAQKEYLLKISDENYQMTEVKVSGEDLLEGYTFRLQEPGTSLAVEYIRL